ncbi:alpha/beta hydrolase [Labrenzia sp. PHM005]|uniref:alpha/beta hydrolase n=1 Tax=Labrenzia sp. PHM005 TaxID=2590016 RepID=UPI0011401D8E|nr:alpha/beta fold hydrolase [Labrenzia sp. PHM005]QDG74446.1 alpha/beta fold hydrolase [Labrenzia sp. PHM005]
MLFLIGGLLLLAIATYPFVFTRWVISRNDREYARLWTFLDVIQREAQLDSEKKLQLYKIILSTKNVHQEPLEVEDLMLLEDIKSKISSENQTKLDGYLGSNLFFLTESQDNTEIIIDGISMPLAAIGVLLMLGGSFSVFEPLSEFFSKEEGIKDDPADPKSDRRYAIQRIYYGTDRAATKQTPKGPDFGFQRANKLSVGFADVTIPSKVHRVGQIELPRSVTVFTLTISEKEDSARHFTIHKISQLGINELKSRASKAATKAKGYPATAFIFIHGFNTSFRSAVFRTAQLAWDLRFDGPAFLYSWPSVGDTKNYVTDIDAAAEAAPHMDKFFDLVLAIPGIERVHLVAHSMGNYALAELFKRAETRLSKRQDAPFDEIILASPDINVRSFRQVRKQFDRFAEDVTLYASSTDKALLASKKIRSDFERLGDVGNDGPAVFPGVYSIDVSSEGTEIFSTNHNIYVESKLILSDLGQLFRFGRHPPDWRTPAFYPKAGKNGRYWYVPY